MSVILRDTVPPIIEVAKLGYAAVAAHSLLYQSAYQDQRFDSRNISTVKTEENEEPQQIDRSSRADDLFSPRLA